MLLSNFFSQFYAFCFLLFAIIETVLNRAVHFFRSMHKGSMGACFYCAFRINRPSAEVPGEQKYVYVMRGGSTPEDRCSIYEKDSRIKMACPYPSAYRKLRKSLICENMFLCCGQSVNTESRHMLDSFVEQGECANICPS